MSRRAADRSASRPAYAGQASSKVATAPEGRRAYAAELGGIARCWRYAGLALVAAGAILLIAAR